MTRDQSVGVLYRSLIGKMPTPLHDTGFSVCTQLEEREQVIRPCSDWLIAYLSCVGDNAMIGWLPTSPV